MAKKILLREAMFAIVGIFQEHAGKDEDNLKLSKEELKELLQSEFGGLGDPAEVDKSFNKLNKNSDEGVDFKEFMEFVTGMTMTFHGLFKLVAQK